MIPALSKRQVQIAVKNLAVDGPTDRYCVCLVASQHECHEHMLEQIINNTFIGCQKTRYRYYSTDRILHVRLLYFAFVQDSARLLPGRSLPVELELLGIELYPVVTRRDLS